MAAVRRISLSPPSSGVSPMTVLAMRGTVTMPMIRAPPTSRWVALAAAKTRDANIEMGTRGSDVRACLKTKSSIDTTARDR